MVTFECTIHSSFLAIIELRSFALFNYCKKSKPFFAAVLRCGRILFAKYFSKSFIWRESIHKNNSLYWKRDEKHNFFVSNCKKSIYRFFLTTRPETVRAKLQEEPWLSAVITFNFIFFINFRRFKYSLILKYQFLLMLLELNIINSVISYHWLKY